MKQRRRLRDGFNVIDHDQLDLENVTIVHGEGRVRGFHQPRCLEIGGGFDQLPESFVRPASAEQRARVVRRTIIGVDATGRRRTWSSEAGREVGPVFRVVVVVALLFLFFVGSYAERRGRASGVSGLVDGAGWRGIVWGILQLLGGGLKETPVFVHLVTG